MTMMKNKLVMFIRSLLLMLFVVIHVLGSLMLPALGNSIKQVHSDCTGVPCTSVKTQKEYSGRNLSLSLSLNPFVILVDSPLPSIPH